MVDRFQYKISNKQFWNPFFHTFSHFQIISFWSWDDGRIVFTMKRGKMHLRCNSVEFTVTMYPITNFKWLYDMMKAILIAY